MHVVTGIFDPPGSFFHALVENFFFWNTVGSAPICQFGNQFFFGDFSSIHAEIQITRTVEIKGAIRIFFAPCGAQPFHWFFIIRI